MNATHNHHHLQHSHEYLQVSKESERKTFVVMLLTIVTMVLEIIFGFISNSMALLADGFHMATHSAALGIAYFAYRYARKNIKNTSYSFGT
jgi:Co/Zn/Cd efflux system component